MTRPRGARDAARGFQLLLPKRRPGRPVAARPPAQPLTLGPVFSIVRSAPGLLQSSIWGKCFLEKQQVSIIFFPTLFQVSAASNVLRSCELVR